MSPHTSTSTTVTADSASSNVRVIVVNDYEIVVNGITAMLARSPEVELLGATTPLDELGPRDVVLFDTFGQPDAWTRLDDIVAKTSAQVLIFSWADTPDSHQLFVSRGAAGYLFKGATAVELVAALLAVAGGGFPLRVDGVGDDPLGSWPGQDAGLSGREAEVLALIVLGLSNIEIGERLFLSVNTVKTYIRTGYRKIGVSNRSRAVLWAVHHGFRSAAP